MEDDVWRQVELARLVLAQSSQEVVQLLVESARHIVGSLFGLVELAVGHHHERLRVLHVALAVGRELEQTVVFHILPDEMGDHGLAYHRVPNGRVLLVDLLACAKLGQLVVPMAHNVVGASAPHEVDDVRLVEVFLHRLDGAEHHEQRLRRLLGMLGVHAVVAIATVVLGISLTEIVQQHLTPTDRRLGVSLRLLQELPSDLFLCLALAVHKLLEFLQVLGRVEGYANALSPIAAGATRFLIVSLETLGNVVMYDESHIGLVDAHAEGDGRHDDVYFLLDEVVLRHRSHLGVESGVVGRGLEAVELQLLRQFLHLLARQAVDDATLALVLPEESDDLAVGVLLAHFLPDLIIEVGAVERALELLGVDDAQALLDVGAHLVGGRRRKRYDGNLVDAPELRYLVDGGPDVAILGPEIVPPLGDAMSLIDGKERNLKRLEERKVVLLVERLGSHVQQFSLTRLHIAHHAVDGRLVERRVHVMGQAVVLRQSVDDVHLVLHQGDQWRHHDGRS